MDTITMIVGGALVLLLVVFLGRLFFTILVNRSDGQKFHQSLAQELNKLRLNKMLTVLGISKTEYIYRTSVNEIHQQMKKCTDCTNTAECDEKLTAPELDVADIDFCNNEADLVSMKQQAE